MTKKFFLVSVVWLLVIIVVEFLYSSVAKNVIELIPFSAMVLMPFGWESFFQWVLFGAVSYWAITVLGWDEPLIHKGAKLLLVAAIFLVLLDVILIGFIVAKGGL